MKIDINTSIEIDSSQMGLKEPDSLGAFDNCQDDIEFPRRIQTDKIDNIEFDQIDFKDYPDFTDAYVISADMNGISMNGEELDELNDKYREFVYEKLIDFLY